MLEESPAAIAASRVLNACWLVRYRRRPHQERDGQAGRAWRDLGQVVVDELGRDRELARAVLTAVAEGLAELVADRF